MNVVLVNVSSRKNGCTGAALAEVARALQEEGVETEDFFIGNAPLADCIGCRKCRQTGKCVFDDDVNRFIERAPGGRLCIWLSGLLCPPQRPVAGLNGQGLLRGRRRVCL